MELRFNHAFMLHLCLQLQLDVGASQTTTCIQKRKLAQNNIIDGEGMVKVYALKKIIIIIIYVHQVDELQTKG